MEGATTPITLLLRGRSFNPPPTLAGEAEAAEEEADDAEDAFAKGGDVGENPFVLPTNPTADEAGLAPGGDWPAAPDRENARPRGESILGPSEKAGGIKLESSAGEAGGEPEG